MTRTLRRLVAFAALASVALIGHVAVRAAGSEVSMVEVTGDGARYWRTEEALLAIP